MAVLREGFHAIIAAWTMDGFDELTDRIERLATWTSANGGLDAYSDDERMIVQSMIDTQISMGDVYCPPAV